MHRNVLQELQLSKELPGEQGKPVFVFFEWIISGMKGKGAAEILGSQEKQSYCILMSCSVPGTILGALQSSFLILSRILEGDCYHSHFTDEETEAERS